MIYICHAGISIEYRGPGKVIYTMQFNGLPIELFGLIMRYSYSRCDIELASRRYYRTVRQCMLNELCVISEVL